MPYILNLKQVCNRTYQINVNPYGWINPVKIEYGIGYISDKDPEPSVCFRVVKTSHVWAIFESQLRQISRGDYVSYFTKKLEEFRLDFLVWIHTPDFWRQSWVKEYYEMFKGMFYDFSPEEKEDFESSSTKFNEAKQGLEEIGKYSKNQGR